MRVVCESCAAPQPADWRAGDRCTSCGAVARRELRCGWCTTWTPEGSFCRECGAELVSDDLYGAARMLKHAGVDQFSVSERLASLGPDRTLHFTRLYQRDAAIVARVVDDVAFVEGLLRQRGWAADVDDALTRELPWDDDERQAWSGAIEPVELDERARLARLVASARLDELRVLAALALLRRGHPCDDAQLDTARLGLGHSNVRTADEAALVFAHWCVVHLLPPVARSAVVLDALTACSLTGPAAIGRALLGDGSVDRAALADVDPDDAFAAALVLGDVDVLRAAVLDPQRRYPAALAAARHGHAALLVGVLALLDEDRLAMVVEELDARRTPFPVLREDLVGVVARTESSRTAVRAATVIGRDPLPDDGLRLLRARPGDRSVTQAVLQRFELPPAELVAIAQLLLDEGRLNSAQYGVDDLADRGRLPDTFVPTAWSRTLGEERALGLLRFAERQLAARGDADLHRFVLGVVWGDGPAAVREEAWWCLRRWYPQYGDEREGPLEFGAAAMVTWFGSVPRFLDRLAAYVEAPDQAGGMALREHVVRLLRYTDTARIASVAEADAKGFEAFVARLDAALGDARVEREVRSAILTFCYWLGFVPGRFDRTVALLERHAGDDEIGTEAASTAERLRVNVDRG